MLMCALVYLFVYCVRTRVWIFIRWKMSYLPRSPSPPHINYIRPVIYGLITECKAHYFLMETGWGRDPSAHITVGLIPTTSHANIQLTYHHYTILLWSLHNRTMAASGVKNTWNTSCHLTRTSPLRAGGEPLNLLVRLVLGQQRHDWAAVAEKSCFTEGQQRCWHFANTQAVAWIMLRLFSLQLHVLPDHIYSFIDWPERQCLLNVHSKYYRKTVSYCSQYVILLCKWDYTREQLVVKLQIMAQEAEWGELEVWTTL